MSKPQDRLVYRSGTGWANARVGAERAERIYATHRVKRFEQPGKTFRTQAEAS